VLGELGSRRRYQAYHRYVEQGCDEETIAFLPARHSSALRNLRQIAWGQKWINPASNSLLLFP